MKNYFCQKILPTVYDDSMSYYEVLCKLTGKVNEVIENGNEINQDYAQISEELKKIEDFLKTITPEPLSFLKRYVVLGDSYGVPSDGWTTILQEYLGAENEDYYQFSEGSMGMCQTGSSGHTALTLLQSKMSTIENPETITDVVIGIGINDYSYTYADLDSAFSNFVQYIHTNFVNAKIELAWVGYSYGQLNQTLSILFGNYMQLCSKYGIDVLEGVWNIIHNNKLMSIDSIHPTSQGSLEIAKGVASAINFGKYYYSNSSYFYMTGSGITNALQVFEAIFGDFSLMQINRVVFNGPFNLSSSFVNVYGFTESDHFLRGSGNTANPITCYVAGDNMPQVLNMTLNNNSIYLQRNGTAIGSSTNIQLYNATYFCPTFCI